MTAKLDWMAVDPAYLRTLTQPVCTLPCVMFAISLEVGTVKCFLIVIEAAWLHKLNAKKMRK